MATKIRRYLGKGRAKRVKQMKLIITNKNKQGAVVHITNDKQRIKLIKQRAKSKGDKVEVQQ